MGSLQPLAGTTLLNSSAVNCVQVRMRLNQIIEL